MKKRNDAMECIGRQVVFLWLSCGIALSAWASNLGSAYYEAKPSVSVLNDQVGEQLDLRTGQLSLEHIDLSIRVSDDLSIVVSRKLDFDASTFDVGGFDLWQSWGGGSSDIYETKNTQFGGVWRLAGVPSLRGTFEARNGWVVNSSPYPNGDWEQARKRCSAGLSPYTVMGLYPFYGMPILAKQYFSGISLNVPGGGGAIPAGRQLRYPASI